MYTERSWAGIAAEVRTHRPRSSFRTPRLCNELGQRDCVACKELLGAHALRRAGTQTVFAEFRHLDSAEIALGADCVRQRRGLLVLLRLAFRRHVQAGLPAHVCLDPTGACSDYL
ncbi:hypothetical protein NDU88_001860 [Pleurodeles waltl]|uniref:Uncharacterized protein n=1 Tax=Pleurodeles waltl TaxID=8319 RepID=A0AAV7KSK7_PLEWA|nr:hypothetical protein NDU88_001860 [Pleurodeles waltl]